MKLGSGVKARVKICQSPEPKAWSGFAKGKKPESGGILRICQNQEPKPELGTKPQSKYARNQNQKQGLQPESGCATSQDQSQESKPKIQ